MESDVRVFRDGVLFDTLDGMAGALGIPGNGIDGYLLHLVVDLETGWIAAGGELHSDGEDALLDLGSRQSDLWGLDYYTDRFGEDRADFHALINQRGSNPSDYILDGAVREAVLALLSDRVDE